MTPCCRHHSLTERPLLRHYWICAAHSCSSARCFNSALVILTPHNTTVAKPFATFRYYCLMCVYARLGLTVTINPYFPRENGGCVYPYFFDMMVDGKPILDTLDAMYRSQNIEDFMRSSYAYCQEHETVIREHILKSEG